MFGADARPHGFPLAGRSGEKYPPESLAGQPRVGGRLTLTSGVPETTANVASAGTLYLTPFRGGVAPMLTSGGWKLLPFPEVSLPLSGLASTLNYDAFDLDAGDGTLTLDLGPAWSSDTARSLAVSPVDGNYVNAAGFTTFRGRSVQPFRARLRGTIRATGSGVTDDTFLRRAVSNLDNPLPRPLKAVESTTSWPYGVNSWRQANASGANQLEFVQCVSRPVRAQVLVTVDVASTQQYSPGIGLDSTTVNGATLSPTSYTSGAQVVRDTPTAAYEGYPGQGYHFLAWLERAPSGIAATAYGYVADFINSGIIGSVWG
jgi:hypothetical protein